MKHVGYPLLFKPIAQERLWGGNKLSPMFGLGEQGQIGEIWTLSDHPNAPSICANGELEGKTLSEIIQMYPELYLGKPWSEDRFPLLIKFLHAEQDLSVQIHPDDHYGLKVEGDYGKTEAWYFLDAEADSRVNYGHRFISAAAYYEAIKDKKVKDYLSFYPVKKGDFVFVPSRTLHALLRGTMVVEIQQTSDVTYRVYDWDRVDAEGQSRELHVDKAADVMRYEARTQEASPFPVPEIIVDSLNVTHQKLITCPYFTIEKLELDGFSSVSLTHGNVENPDILVVLEGEGSLIYRLSDTETTDKKQVLSLKQGDTLLIPANIEEYFIEGSELLLLRSYY